MNFFPFVPVDVSAMFSGLSALPGPCPVSGEVFTHVVMQLFWGVLGCVFIGSPPHCTRGDRAYRVNLNPGMTGSLPDSGAGGSDDKMFIVNYLSALRGAPGWSEKGVWSMLYKCQ